MSNTVFTYTPLYISSDCLKTGCSARIPHSNLEVESLFIHEIIAGFSLPVSPTEFDRMKLHVAPPNFSLLRCREVERQKAGYAYFTNIDRTLTFSRMISKGLMVNSANEYPQVRGCRTEHLSARVWIYTSDTT